jgi:hypothetical protein
VRLRRRSAAPAPEPAPVTLFTFFLELPFALPLPADNSIVTVGTPRDEHWRGWSDKHVSGLFSKEDREFPPGLGPGTRMVVRHVGVNQTVPLFAAEEAFGDWVDELFPEDVARERAEKRRAWSADGLEVRRSVVALSRYLPRTAHPRGGEMTVGWILSQFRLALSDLNGVLEALGFVLGRWSVGTLSLRDLPAELPVLIGSSHRPAPGRPPGITFTARVHDAYPLLVDAPEPDFAPAAEAIGLSNRARHDEEPYMLVFRFLHSALSERLAGGPTRAVIDLNTAVEIMIRVTVVEGAEAAGLSAQEIESAEEAGARKRVSRYLSKVCDGSLDIDDPESIWGRWFSDGYKQRNLAVHQGQAVDRDALDRAFDQAGAVVEDVKDRLEVQPALRDLGRKLALRFSGTRPSFEEEVLPIAFPWE